MKHFFRVMPALLAILFGSLVLLTLLAWASLQESRLEGTAYYFAVLGKLFGPRSTWATLTATVVVVLGLAHLLRGGFLAGADVHERREALPVFWLALGIGTATLFGVLICVNYFSLQAGEVRPIVEWFWRNR